MNQIVLNKKNTYNNEKPILWLFLALYILVTGYTILHHEPWGDELHSWNISKASDTISSLIYNTRYEGHPPVWFFVLWTIAQCTHNFLYVQLVHLAFASALVYVILFHAPFSKATKLLFPFGYYFLFEYAVVSRNYILGVFLGFLICIVIHKEFKYKLALYYSLLLLMSNVHLLSLILAGCLHLYFLLALIEQKKQRTIIMLHAIAGIIVFIPAIYFIMPPSDSQLGAHDWKERWSQAQFAIALQAPLRAFVPIPAWWQNYYFWNQQFLLSLHEKYKLLKFLYPLLSLCCIGVGCYILKANTKSVILFLANVIATFVIGNVLSLDTQRYTGYIFIGFVVAYWLASDKNTGSKLKNRLVNSLLIIQALGGVFMVIKDINMPFSNAYKIKELSNEVPPNTKLVADYWTSIPYVAYTDTPIYCIDLQKNVVFDLWQMDVREMMRYPYRFCRGFNNLFKNENIKTVYFISLDPPKLLTKTDSKLFSSFSVKLIDQRQGAISKSSDLYLYQITALK